MINCPGDEYKLLTVVKEMITKDESWSGILSDYASEDYADVADEILKTIEPVDFGDKPHDFLIEALDTYLDIQANIWSEKREIELMEDSDDPDSFKPYIAERKRSIQSLEQRMPECKKAFAVLEDWVRTGDLTYTRLRS